MAVDDELRYSPHGGINTIQFSSDTLNVIAASLLATLITANISSIVSKLMHTCRRDSFTYKSWLRSVIYANTNDPLRILSWIRGKHFFRQPSRHRPCIQPRPSRLLVPLLGQAVTIVATFGFIALSISTESKYSGCQQGDYSIVWDMSKAANSSIPRSVCTRIPLTSNIGQVRSTAEYCYSSVHVTAQQGEPQGTTLLEIQNFVNSGFVHIYVAPRDIIWRTEMTVQYVVSANAVYFPKFRSHDLEAILNISVRAVQFMNRRCAVLDRDNGTDEEGEDEVRYFSAELDCDLLESSEVGLLDYLRLIGAYVKTSLQWKKQPTTQERIKETPSATEVSTECPVMISVSEPIINLIPLTIILAVVFLVNVKVSFVTSRRGNAIDAGYHIVAESLGLDTTANPLEANIEQDQKVILKLRNWMCADGGTGHIGFIGRSGDVPVDVFSDSVAIGRCEQAATDLESARTLTDRFDEEFAKQC